MRNFLPFMVMCILSLTAYAQAPTLVPFSDCGESYFLASAPGGPQTSSTLSSVDTTTFTSTSFSSAPLQINALGFNPADNLLYGMNDLDSTGIPNLYAIGALGNSELLGQILPPMAAPDNVPAVLWYVGDIDPNGIYYFPAVTVDTLTFTYSMHLGSLDLTTLPPTGPFMPTYTPITGGTCQTFIDNFVFELIAFNAGLGPEPSGGIQDWSYNANDGMLYSYMGVEGQVFVMDPLNPVAECYASPAASLSEFGGILVDNENNMYGFESNTGVIYEVNIDCPSAACGTLTAVNTFTGGNIDVAGCSALLLPAALVPFAGCGDAFFLVSSEGQGSTKPSSLYEIDTLDITALPFGNPLPPQINALGYNPMDDFLYAMNDADTTGSPDLYKIDANGNYEVLGQILPPPTIATDFGTTVLWHVGDVDAAGIYHFPAVVVQSVVPAAYTMYLGSLDLNNLLGTGPFTPVYKEIIGGTCQPYITTFVTELVAFYGGVGPEPSGGIQDWAINPTNGMLYSYMGIEGQLFVMDPTSTTPTAECYSGPTAGLTEFGGILFDGEDDMYGFESTTGTVYEINFDCPSADCGTLTPVSTFLANQSVDAASCPNNVPLPLEVVEFYGEIVQSDVVLNWHTAFEAEINRFIVERSTDGIDFSSIGEVRSLGNSTNVQNYRFEDENPMPGLNYYRLAIVEQDNAIDYHEQIVVLELSKGNLYFTLQPNPAIENLELNILAGSNLPIQVEIFDISGHKVTETIEIAPNSLYKTIDLSNLASGMYFLKANNGLHGYAQRFIIQK